MLPEVFLGFFSPESKVLRPVAGKEGLECPGDSEEFLGLPDVRFPGLSISEDENPHRWELLDLRITDVDSDEATFPVDIFDFNHFVRGEILGVAGTSEDCDMDENILGSTAFDESEALGGVVEFHLPEGPLGDRLGGICSLSRHLMLLTLRL